MNWLCALAVELYIRMILCIFHVFIILVVFNRIFAQVFVAVVLIALLEILQACQNGVHCFTLIICNGNACVIHMSFVRERRVYNFNLSRFICGVLIFWNNCLHRQIRSEERRVGKELFAI